MDFNELMTYGYSVRKISDRPVSDVQIENILKAAQIAPVNKNISRLGYYALRKP